MSWTEPDGPVAQGVHPRPPLTRAQRRRAAVAGLGPIAVTALVLTPFAVIGGYSAADVAVGALVYGGLLGLAAAFVSIDRAHAWQCGRCGERHSRRATECERCGYDLAQRPRYACTERHTIYLDPGSCACGRRLGLIRTVRGIGREVAVALVVGGVLLVFLIAVGLALRVLEG